MSQEEQDEKEDSQRNRDGESRSGTGKRHRCRKCCKRSRDIPGDALQLEVEIQWDGGQSDPSAERVGGRESEAQADVR